MHDPDLVEAVLERFRLVRPALSPAGENSRFAGQWLFASLFPVTACGAPLVTGGLNCPEQSLVSI